jgi:lipopolysaccharide/colanic/teichoic acid biosynthesis glycosyltransferase
MVKRAFDFFISLFGLAVSFPLWLIFSFLIRLEDRGQVFYCQDRAGKGGRIFKSIKFRSMKPGAEEGLGPVQAKGDDSRITKIGKLLRKTAMDELPQLLNILKGDMSFVGPRALRPMEIELNGNRKPMDISQVPGFHKRSSVRPGLTGVAQVFASRTLSREEKFKFDLWYIDNVNFWLDIKLVALSFLTTLRARWDK